MVLAGTHHVKFYVYVASVKETTRTFALLYVL